jgi:hypothetical protein
MYLNWRLTLLFIIVMTFIGLVVRFTVNFLEIDFSKTFSISGLTARTVQESSK